MTVRKIISILITWLMPRKNLNLKIADAGSSLLPASTVHRILCEEVPMYPMDRIQQKHARQIDLLENLTAVIQDYPNPACIRGETGKFIFCNTLFHESFLTQDQSAEKWLLSQRWKHTGMSIRILIL